MSTSTWTPDDAARDDGVRVQLARCLDDVASAADPQEGAEALRALAAWLDDEDGRCAVAPDAEVEETSRAARLWLLWWTLTRHPGRAAHLGRTIATLTLSARCTSFFARTGIATEARLTSELVDRIARKLLPQVGADEELGPLLGDVLERRMFMLHAPAPLLHRLWDLLCAQEPQLASVRSHLEAGLVEAAVLVGARLAAIGTSEDVRARSSPGPLQDSPFVVLSRRADALLHQAAPGAVADVARALRASLAPCHEAILRARQSLEHGSVNADLVFRLDVADRMLARLDLMCTVLTEDNAARAPWRALLETMLDARDDDTTLRGLVRSSSRLLAKRIVETSAQTGEHYIARNAQEYRHMWFSAGGGGALMAVVAPVKFMLAGLKLPLFFAGLAAGVNYALAFIAMQALGLTLATKQPSMTAASLAGAFGDDLGTQAGPAGRARMVELIVRTTRTQLAAIAGNLGVLIPVSVTVHFGILALMGAPFLDAEKAVHVLRGHSPIASGSVLFAALTGVWLWLSSIAAGWFDNWLRFRRLPEALLGNRRMRRLLGRARADRVANLVDRAAAPLVGNVVIGMLLGLTPAFAGFFGAPLEIRHITISTASVVLASLSLGPALVPALLGWAVAGLVAIAAMNFVVSFTLALLVALRARDVGADVARAVLMDVLKMALRHPIRFVGAVRDPVAATRDR